MFCRCLVCRSHSCAFHAELALSQLTPRYREDTGLRTGGSLIVSMVMVMVMVMVVVLQMVLLVLLVLLLLYLLPLQPLLVLPLPILQLLLRQPAPQRHRRGTRRRGFEPLPQGMPHRHGTRAPPRRT
jgi:hypothetical protein